MSGNSLLCARRGCAHTKAEHDDPLMEGMCVHNGCECLGFVQAGVRAAQPVPPAPAPPSTPVDEPVDIPDASATAASTAPSSGPGPDPAVADAPSFPQSSQELLDAERQKVEAATAEAAQRIAEMKPPIEERYVLAHEKHTDGKKRCPHCEEIRPVEDFSPVKGNYDGVHGWCRPCMNARPFSPTLARALRNRARHRASAELIQKHLDEFNALYATYHDIVVEEAQLLADAEAAKEVYGDGPGEHVRLKPGRRQKGETVIDRIDVARCPECVKHHDAGHVCEVCGAAPVHREITQSAWAGTQEKLREKMAAKKAAGE